MREGTGILIFLGIAMAYFGITWLIYDWITKPIAEMIILFIGVETEAPLNEGGTKLTVQLLLPIVIASFGYLIVKVINDTRKDITGIEEKQEQTKHG